MQHTHLCFIFSDKEFVDLRDKAWFRATIVTSPINSASKKRKRALVEYKSHKPKTARSSSKSTLIRLT
ncbi:unnamed protein product [Prunus brigantina]